MLKKTIVGITSALVMGTMIGCSGMTKQDLGVITGGAIGGALGSQFGGGSGKILAAVGGTVLGAALGGAIGKNMDQTDELRMNQALENSRVDQPTTWRNPDSGNVYTVRPTRTYYHHAQPCREFTTRAVIGGRPEIVHGKACRRANGTWRMV